jgi:hypothetical protein
MLYGGYVCIYVISHTVACWNYMLRCSCSHQQVCAYSTEPDTLYVAVAVVSRVEIRFGYGTKLAKIIVRLTRNSGKN